MSLELKTAAARDVIVGYDGSRSAQRALARAASAAGADGHVVVVIAAKISDETRPEARRTADDPLLLLREARLLLRDHEVRVSTRAVEADPVDALVETAKEMEAALIVVGARGDDFVARTVRGSVSERLVARTPCDLLIAH